MVTFSVTLRSWVIRPIDALDLLCAQLTRDLFAIAKFLFKHLRVSILLDVILTIGYVPGLSVDETACSASKSAQIDATQEATDAAGSAAASDNSNDSDK